MFKGKPILIVLFLGIFVFPVVANANIFYHDHFILFNDNGIMFEWTEESESTAQVDDGIHILFERTYLVNFDIPILNSSDYLLVSKYSYILENGEWRLLVTWVEDILVILAYIYQ